MRQPRQQATKGKLRRIKSVVCDSLVMATAVYCVCNIKQLDRSAHPRLPKKIPGVSTCCGRGMRCGDPLPERLWDSAVSTVIRPITTQQIQTYASSPHPWPMGPEPRSSSITGAADPCLAYTGRGLGAVRNSTPTDRPRQHRRRGFRRTIWVNADGTLKPTASHISSTSPTADSGWASVWAPLTGPPHRGVDLKQIPDAGVAFGAGRVTQTVSECAEVF